MRQAFALSDNDLPSRSEVIERYRHLRRISKMHHSTVLKFLPRDAVLRFARRLGLAQGRTFVLDDPEQLFLAIDLAIYAAPPDRSRAIDRYARAVHYAEGSDDALVLEAMRAARFALITLKGRHPAAGLIALDVFRNAEVWLVDEGLEASLAEGDTFATRYYAPDRFAMTAGVLVPADLELLTDAVDSAPQLTRKSHAEAIDDPRFAEAIYRTALAEGVMDGVRYQNPGGAEDAA